MIADPHKNPAPNAAHTTKSLSFINPFTFASERQIGIDAAVVFPYFSILSLQDHYNNSWNGYWMLKFA